MQLVGEHGPELVHLRRGGYVSALLSRYQVFSHSHQTRDHAIPRCGSTLLLFLEPKG